MRWARAGHSDHYKTISSLSATGLSGPRGIRIDTPSPILTSTSMAPAFLAARIARSISAWLILAGRLLMPSPSSRSPPPTKARLRQLRSLRHAKASRQSSSYVNGARSRPAAHIVGRRRRQRVASGSLRRMPKLRPKGARDRKLAILAALEEIYMNQNLDIGPLPAGSQGCHTLSPGILGRRWRPRFAGSCCVSRASWRWLLRQLPKPAAPYALLFRLDPKFGLGSKEGSLSNTIRLSCLDDCLAPNRAVGE
jgi:hypothetical protein